MKLFLVITLIGVVAAIQEDRMFIIESSNEEEDRKMVVTWSEDSDSDGRGCEIFSDQHLISAVLHATGDEVVVRPTYEEEKEWLEECDSFSINRRWSSSDSEEDNEEDNGWNAIFPGTEWCGAGNISDGYEDLGEHQKTDRCCRAHDNCDDLLISGETRNNLTNTSPFTKLSCKCDNDFYDCLEDIDSFTSNTIGNIYFNLLANSCYEKRHPTTDKCKKYKTFLKLICSEYEVDLNAPKEYQWVKARKYKKFPL